MGLTTIPPIPFSCSILFYSFCDLNGPLSRKLNTDTDPVNFKGMATHLVRVIDCDLESTKYLPLGWVLVDGEFELVLGPTLPIECWRMVVEVHNPDGDWDHGLGTRASWRVDLCYLGWGQVAMAIWQADCYWS